MLEEIEINNYKMIDSLNISGFSNINILVGKMTAVKHQC